MGTSKSKNTRSKSATPGTDGKKIDKSKQGCAVSFLNEERGELDPLCERSPDELDEYVQPRKEKEAGGEG